MASFIELPRVGYRGIDMPSLFVNLDDIVCFESDHDDQTVVTIRHYGSEGHGRVTTYLPLPALSGYLYELGERPGIHTWTESTKQQFRSGLVPTLVARADRERNGAGH